MIFSMHFVRHVQAYNYSATTVACVTTDIVKMYQTHYIYLLHSSNGEGKFLRNISQARKELNLFQNYSIPFAH